MSKVIQRKFKILCNKKVGPDYFRMAISAPRIAKQAKPGQFVHLRSQENFEPLLRRPFSFHRLNGDSFEILYKIVGRGTNLLAKKRKRDRIDILGPLGNGFDIQRTNEPTSGSRSSPSFEPSRAQARDLRTTILVAGGMGVAPLVALAEDIVHSVHQFTVHSKKGKLYVLIGASTKSHILCEKDFKRLGTRVQIATDDGSRGHKGAVTGLLKGLLRTTHNAQRTMIYACGPKPMLKEIARIAKGFRIPVQGSLEENMACGVGACLGCAIETKVGYKRVCKDGPVFNLQEIKW